VLSARRPVALGLLVVLGGVALYAAVSFGGAAAGVLAALALAFAAAIAVRATRPGDASERERLGRLGAEALCLLPGVLVLYVGFTAGGFFPDSWGFVTAALAVALLVRIVLARRPFEGLGWGVGLAAWALALYTAWAYGSGAWSHAPARALIEADRALMYLFALVLFGSLARTPERARIMVRGLALAFFVIALAGLLSRLLPELVPSTQLITRDRLSYPVTYWNCLGLVGALGAILCLHLASDEKEPAALRVLGAAALPTLVTCLYFTLSRGAIAVALGGLVAYLLFGRPRGLVSGLLATVPAGLFALSSAYGAELLAHGIPADPAAVLQGQGVARTVLLCTLAAAVVRAALLLLDAGLKRIEVPERAARPLGIAVVVLLVVLAGSAAVALDAPQRVAAKYQAFLRDPPASTPDPRQRLTQVSNNGRLAHWRVAERVYRAAPVRGHGAGTFEVEWARYRPTDFTVLDAHSLYLENLGELGIVGLALLGVALLAILAAFALRARGPHRALHGALLAAGLAWAVRAGIDWDWEMPVVTLWLFAAGGLALARSRPDADLPTRSGLPLRAAVGLACVALALPSLVVAVSERGRAAGLDAFKRGDCPAATAAANRSLSALDTRAEPYEVIGYCQAAAGAYRAGAANFQAAARDDPENWEPQFGLALTRAAAGLDPRAAAARSVRLNPLVPESAAAARRLARSSDPAEWAAIAESTALPKRFRAE